MYRTRIRNLREDRDLSQEDLAAFLQVHQTTYSSYELGKLGLPIESLSMLADFYGVSTDYLLGRTDIKEPYPKKK